MEAIQEILSREISNMTMPTKISSRLNCDHGDITLTPDKDVVAAETIRKSNISDFSKPTEACRTCGHPIQIDIEILGVLRRLPVACQCREDELRQEKEREEFQALQRKLNKFKAYSLMDERFKESTFENWKFREDNSSLYNFGKRYCENWESMKNNNRGLLIHGIAGNGKTFLSFAVANELYRYGKAVLAISVSRILQIIMDSYKQHGEFGEIDILNTLFEASLLILDDLGVEYKTHWSSDKLYSIIDTRYRAKKPTIITTNLTLEELRYNLSVIDVKSGSYDRENRIYSRITEMCVPIEIKGGSWRIQKGEENRADLFRELGLTTG